MGVEFIKQLHRDALEKAWNARPAKTPVDPMLKRRQNVLSRIEAALAQLENGETNPRRGLYQSRDNFNGVRVQLKWGQRTLTIDGRDHWFVEDAATFFNSARDAVASGELDGAINAALKGKSTRAMPKRKPHVSGKAPKLVVAADAEPAADEPHPVKPGKYAQKYEKLLAAGIISEPAL